MKNNEQILYEARKRWGTLNNVESLILEIRSLHAEIEIYRNLVTLIRKSLDVTTKTLRNKGGE